MKLLLNLKMIIHICINLTDRLAIEYTPTPYIVCLLLRCNVSLSCYNDAHFTPN